MNIGLIEKIFADNFVLRGELGASVSIWKDGVEKVTLAGGFTDREKTRAWTSATPVLVWSATKGPAAACALHCLQASNIPTGERVAKVWPEFGGAGKGHVTFDQLLSHQAGVPALDRDASVLDYEGVIAAIEHQSPAWPLDAGHGYHPRTFGYMLDEVVRRLSGAPLGVYWRKIFADPLGLDFWIGMPPDRIERVAPVFASRSAPPADDPSYAALAMPGSLSARAFASPKGLNSVSSMNSPEARAASLPAFGGIGTAAALARFYGMLACGGEMDGRLFFTREEIGRMISPLVNGLDQVLKIDTSFSAGLMKDPVTAGQVKSRSIFGASREAFGHPGAGGSLGFADPASGIGFAYVMNQMTPGVFPNEKALLMTAALAS